MPAKVSSHSPSSWFQHLLPIELPPLQVDLVGAEDRPSTKVARGCPREFGFGVLSAICGPELIDRVLSEGGRQGWRCRLLPARLTVHALLLMCLQPSLG